MLGKFVTSKYFVIQKKYMYPSNLEQIITTQLFLIRAKQTKQNKNLTEKRVHNDNFAACTMGVSEER